MRALKYVLLAAFAVVLFSIPATKAQAQVGIGINIGTPPVCPYGYYDYSPYNCAPYGYYGPEWFNDGVFVGAGPWFHGPKDFHGHVDNHFDTRHGYHGALPARGEHAAAPAHAPAFHGNEMHDGHGNVVHGGNHGGDNHGGGR